MAHFLWIMVLFKAFSNSFKDFLFALLLGNLVLSVWAIELGWKTTPKGNEKLDTSVLPANTPLISKLDYLWRNMYWTQVN